LKAAFTAAALKTFKHQIMRVQNRNDNTAHSFFSYLSFFFNRTQHARWQEQFLHIIMRTGSTATSEHWTRIPAVTSPIRYATLTSCATIPHIHCA